jgi:hypothetical protein
MANQPQPTPGKGPSTNPPTNPSQTNQQGNRPQPSNVPGKAPQQPGRRNDDETKLPIGDTSGEMEDSSGGRKTGGAPFDPSRSSRGTTASAPGKTTPVEPQNDSDDDSDVERDASAPSERGRSKQQGC